jgi:precorrin-6Y C5,15-methyltransferase (decarboxylating)
MDDSSDGRMPAHDVVCGPIDVIGITDAGAVSLSPEASQLIATAEVLCGGERQLGFFPEHPAERLVFKSQLDQVIARLVDEPRRVVVLASGDPGCYGIGPLLVARLGRERVRILPNLGVVQLAFARLGLSWHDAAILSAHGRPLDGILPAALLAPKVAILTDERNTPAAIARVLLEAGDEDARADVFEHLGGPEERHVTGQLHDLLGQQFAPLNIVVIRHTRPPRSWPLGLPEDAFSHRRGQITKAEVRAVSLAKLRLHERAVLWDVGAGCGSVAIEAGALLRSGRVYAVERDAEQLGYLAENRRRFGAGNVHVIDGTAPEALSALPVPDAIFVGGSRGRLGDIIYAACDRLPAYGRLVTNLVSLEHLGEALAAAEGRGCRAEVTQVSVARSTTTADLTRLEALNPVFVVTLWQEAES